MWRISKKKNTYWYNVNSIKYVYVYIFIGSLVKRNGFVNGINEFLKFSFHCR